jgi:hypothetical protein
VAQAAVHSAGAVVTVDDLTRFETLFADLADDDVMRRAWR